MKLARVLSPFIVMTALSHADRAFGAEPEAVRFEVHAPAECVEEATLREDVLVLGGAFRDANLDDRARTFRIEVERDGPMVTGRLVVRDLAFRERRRAVTKTSCAEVSEALALFVATALDEAPLPLESGPAPVTPPPAPWPEPAATPDRSTYVRADRRGSGGLAASVFASGLTSTTTSEGIRAQGVARVFDGMRVGLAGVIARESRRDWGESLDESSGISTRAGALIGWGAPWNDSVVGFASELGVAWGEHQGTSAPPLRMGAATSSFACARDCYDTSSETRLRWVFVSPYMTGQLVFQVPLKSLPVRPIAAIGALLVPYGPGRAGYLASTAELGLVWQAW